MEGGKQISHLRLLPRFRKFHQQSVEIRRFLLTVAFGAVLILCVAKHLGLTLRLPGGHLHMEQLLAVRQAFKRLLSFYNSS